MIHFLIISSILSTLTGYTKTNDSHWYNDTLNNAALIAIQDSGRIKPLDTFARFRLLRINGRRVHYTENRRKMSAIEWLLDCLFFPEKAKSYRVFLVQNDAVLDAIGISRLDKKKRDRYSYIELESGKRKLFELASEFSKIEEKERNIIQAQTVHLAENISLFELLIHYLKFAGFRYNVLPESTLSQVFSDKNIVCFSDVLHQSNLVVEQFNKLREKSTSNNDPVLTQKLEEYRTLLNDIDILGSQAVAIRLFPPDKPRDLEKEWLTPSDLVALKFFHSNKLDTYINLISTIEKLVAHKNEPDKFNDLFTGFLNELSKLSIARGEYKKIPLEVFFYKSQSFYYSLIIFVFSFIFIALSWLKPNVPFLSKPGLVLVSVATILLTFGITLRCVIRARPPVSTLYESILFITVVAVLVSLFIEFVNRQKAALATAPVLGMIGLFLANKFEVKQGEDTMTSLVAVLDSNFWLSTHVTTITIGYAAGLLAGAIAHVYLILRLVKYKNNDPTAFRNLTRMVYGVICFGLFFSVIGTILGGIWANDSWGRFWGWDPKENGALLIVLWELTILHGRMGGYIRELGINLAAIFGGCIIAFSWWGVNLLGVGLHSYGWTSGVFTALSAFYITEFLIILFIGGWLKLTEVFVIQKKGHTPAA